MQSIYHLTAKGQFLIIKAAISRSFSTASHILPSSSKVTVTVNMAAFCSAWHCTHQHSFLQSWLTSSCWDHAGRVTGTSWKNRFGVWQHRVSAFNMFGRHQDGGLPLLLVLFPCVPPAQINHSKYLRSQPNHPWYLRWGVYVCNNSTYRKVTRDIFKEHDNTGLNAHTPSIHLPDTTTLQWNTNNHLGLRLWNRKTPVSKGSFNTFSHCHKNY